MSKIIATVGISYSGKSTWAREQVESNDNVVIVNRDKIRELLFGYTEATMSEYYDKPKLSKYEKKVTKYSNTLINETLRAGNTVLLDQTNLNRKYLEELKYWNVPVEIKWFPIHIAQALYRAATATRNRKVSEKVIQKQYDQYLLLANSYNEDPIDFTPIKVENNKGSKHCIVVDIDGTLAHMNGRSPYEWKKVGEDTVDPAIAYITTSLDHQSSVEIIIATGRDGSCLLETKDWLEDIGLGDCRIEIRQAGDMRPDWKVKEEFWNKLYDEGYNILAMIDDRLQVVRRARNLGYKVLNVDYNNF